MKYEIILTIEGGYITSRPTDIFAWASVSDVRISGINENPAHRAELRGQPKLVGFVGPLWGGDGVIRYEDHRAYLAMSS